MVRGVVLSAVALFLSACLGAAPPGPKTAAVTTGADVVYDPEEGCFYGRILDDELRPVPDATVTVTETKASVSSNFEGNFRICRLLPGNYTLMVYKPGFLLAVARIKTSDGTGTVQVSLRPVPQPRIEAKPFVVYHRYGYGSVNVSQASGCGPCAFNFFVAKLPNVVLYEATWARSVKLPALADSMTYELKAGNPYPGSGSVLSGTAPHPIRVATDNETLMKFQVVKAAKQWVPLSGTVWCASYPCQEQRVNVWISSFYDYEEIPLNYTALKPA